MIESEFIATLVVAVAAVFVVGANISVRLVLMPRQRDKFILSLVDHLVKASRSVDGWK